jgi:hypothetical protein
MKNNLTFSYFIIVFSLLITNCNKSENTNLLDFNYNYYPLVLNQEREYLVTDILHNSLGSDTVIYFLKEVVSEEFIDQEGDIAYRIERFWKIDSIGEYSIKDVWTSKKTLRTAQKVEENIRFTKLTFPISRGGFWNGNGYNYLPEQEYYYDSIDGASTFGSTSFDSTVYVIQNFKDNLLEFEEAYEVYAKNIGLVYKKYVELNINVGNVLDINEGYEYEQVILNY